MELPDDTIIILLCTCNRNYQSHCLISSLDFSDKNLRIAEQFISHALKTNCFNENSIKAYKNYLLEFDTLR